MRSQKSRSRNKSNRNNRSVGNVVNRVFDSSGPEGKVRGTPQQIIEKYNQLARDAQLSGDRVATENFQQHAEHYLRLLGVAQKEQDARREQQERENRERQQERDRERAKRQERESNGPGDDPAEAPQPDVLEQPEVGDSGLVETPESQQPPKPKRTRKPKAPKPVADAPAENTAEEQPKGDAPDAPEAAE
ncbi:DUF4167 domain-containing protein [uncultured Roseovarius sp.]|uniref:DUF4167 domain-containing protein n=1 Tax=uncultured Roseovarius sp. TaxID=293344 RepID=UPI002627E205|nr:DUF4167 domain-containing protein [uncultured Roseovarius sp.]